MMVDQGTWTLGGAMGSVVARRLLGLNLAFFSITASGFASAAVPVPISKYFPVCITPISGVIHDVHIGIDAAEGQFLGHGGAVDYMINHNPHLPESMGRGVRDGELTEDLRLLAESDGPLQIDVYRKPIGYGVERLYGLSYGNMDTPIGPVQTKIFVQLWAKGHGQNVRLLKKVADALSRCPK